MNDARSLALHILNKLNKSNRTLDSLLEEFQKDHLLSNRERALFNALVYGVLRWKGRLDWIISHLSKMHINKTKPEVLNILRIGLFQIIYLNRIPVSAAVNTSVEMAKHSAGERGAGYVNAILRKASREHETLPYPDIVEEPEYAISANKSFPQWMIKRWGKLFGISQTIELCDAINEIPPITVRVNTLKTNRQDLVNCMESDVRNIRLTACSPDGLSFSNPQKSIQEMEAFKNGWFQVQDEAAQLVSMLLDPRAGDSVLDACAGLGGKTGHIGQLMKNSGKITALDIDKEKLDKLNHEMARLGITNVTTVIEDMENPLLLKEYYGQFDRILIDAPCSNMGVLRRNPDVKWKLQEKNLVRYKKKQLLFLDNLADLLKPSGIMVYAVCSTEPEENEEVIKEFLIKRPDFGIDKNMLYLPESSGVFLNSSGFIKTYPHLNNMDGFFSVRLARLK
ncbi:MAG: 16S rRNA (cytosine(967)-C(5))-methyltransferase RsmB [Proteobacteria bacterium]|nr:16S rRNA (cytosine(967)-C(5))-methyltransferase RsmB [Pseudomonadota bacterium]MBU1713120.1 16S rRNA (cytosine(967)-C(5))-methyltransferase RsmB [Pseudomonadota bacterium]